MGKLIDALIGVSIRRRGLVLIATLLTALAGLWAFYTIDTDAFPELTPNQVIVMTTVGGLSPVEVEQQVTYPMEIAMLGLPKTEGVRSISKVGLSVVTVTFRDDVDLYFARAQVQQRMQDAMMFLPSDAEPMLGPPATAMGEVLHYLIERDTTGATETDTATLIDLTTVQELIVEPRLRTLSGVAEVNTWGGMPQQFAIQVDPTKLSGFGLTLEDVEEAVARNNANFGGGYVEDRGERFTVRGIGRIVDTVALADVVIATRGATPVRVRDVGRVSVTTQPRFGAVSRDGKGEAVTGIVIMLKGSNGRQVVRRALRRIEEIRPVLPPGVLIRPFYNQGDVVDRTTRTVYKNLIEGALLVIAVLFLFLRNARASLLTASVIPLSLLAAFLAMRRFGMSANLMSLGALDFGLLVDASVVMIENIMRRLSLKREAGEDVRDVVRKAALEVGRPVLFGIAIIIAVYIPIVTLEGLEGRMFRPMAFTVCVAVVASLLLALTYIPATASLLLGRAFADGGTSHEGGWFERLRQRYSGLLGKAVGSPYRVMAIASFVLAAALASVPFLGTEFMPALDEGYLLIETRRHPSASLPQGVAISTEVERTLKEFPEVANVVTNLGRPHEATETMALYQGDAYVTFRPKKDWKAESLDDLITQMDSALTEIPGLGFEFSAPMAMRLEEVISGVKTDLGIKVYGDSLPLLQDKAAEIERVLGGVRGAQDVSIGVSDGAMQLQIELDRPAIARYGLSVEAVRHAIEGGIGGRVATQIIDGRRRIPVVVRLDAPHRSTPEAVATTLVNTPGGGTVTLSQIARVTTVEGPEVINHEGGQRYVVVQSNVRGRDLGSFVADVRKVVAREVKLPPGYYLTYGGQFENQARATRRLALIVPIVLLLIATLLYASFGTVRHTMMVITAVPLSIVGGIASLWLTGIHLNLSASVGFIAVAGVAVLNALVLVSYINQLRQDDMPLEDAVREGASVRLRPVLMTALVASVGFIPMAVSTGAGAEVQRPLATVVIGGLASATLLTLFVLPTLYLWVERRRARRRSIVQAADNSHT